MQYAFEKLNAWKESRILVKNVYQLLDNFPKFENYALCDQIRRSIVSVPSNLAEGSGRNHAKDKAHFIDMAYGSLLETYSELETAADLDYITAEEVQNIKPQIIDIGKMLSGLRTSLLNSDNR